MKTQKCNRFSAAIVCAVVLTVMNTNSRAAYRKSIDINAGSGAGTNYQVKIVVGETNGLAGIDVDVEGNAYDFPNDIRFLDNNGVTELPHWLESVSGTAPNRIATFWVKVQDDLDSNQSIYIYYNQPTLGSASDGEATFIFYDDFSGELSKWTTHAENGSVTLLSGYVEIGGGSTDANDKHGWTAIGTEGAYDAFTDGIIDGRVYLSSDAIAEVGFRGDYAADYGYKARFDARSDKGVSHLKPPYRRGEWVVIGNMSGTAIGTGAWKDFSITVTGTSMHTECDGQSRTDTDSEYADPGDLSLQNHYGSYARYDDIRVRKAADTVPAIGTIGAEEFVSEDNPAPSIVTEAASAFSTNSAQFNGLLTSTGTSVTAVSVFWEATDTDQGANTTAWANTNDFGAYSPSQGELPYDYATNITGLAAGTTYTYRYYATNDAAEAWGDAVSFTTYEAPGVPTIDAPSQTGLVHVIISGTVTGGNPDPHAYFCLNAGGDGPSGTTSGWDVVESAGTQSGVFTNTITGLTDDTLYYARVYVTNEVGDAWSDPVSFTTRPPPAQLTLSADDQVDGAAPELVFDEAPDISLAGTGASPANWTFDFAYYGGDPVPVILDTNKLYCGLTGRDDTGTLYFDFNGGSLSGSHTTNAIETYRGTSKNSANVNIVDVGDVDIGGIDARAGRTGWANASQTIYPGYIQIGTDTNRAGNIRAQFLYSFSFSEEPNAERGSRNVTLYGSGNVTVPGDIRTDTQGGSAGHVVIDHQGDLSTGIINADTRGYGVNYPHAGNVTLNGGDSSGNASVSGIQASLTSGQSNNDNTRRTVAISNYHDVVVGDITARYEGDPSAGRFYGSHVEINQNITGDISITGEVDVRSYKDHSHSGYLKLVCAGTVTLASLDLDKVQYASLDSGSGASIITGAIADFDTTTGLAGSGTESDPYTTSEIRLRAPDGQRIYYTYTPGTLNDDLGGSVWQLRNLDGSEVGGLLMVASERATVFRIF